MEAAIVKSDFNNDERLNLTSSLISALEGGDENAVENIIGRLSQSYEQTLFSEVCKLTRHVHDALGFCTDNERISDMAKHDIPDARERLQYVIEKTEYSANRTLDIAEELLKDSGSLARDAVSMKHEWQRFTRREMSVEEFHELSHSLETFLEKIDDDTEKFRGNISDLMIAQDFQDLTGQIIKQVIDLVQEVESKLVKVIRNAGQEKISSVKSGKDIKAEGPQVNVTDDENIANDQEDVDTLLSSLGF